MPGISGIIGLHAFDGNGRLDQMVRCMLHEPFYTSGAYVNQALGLQIGWTAQRDSFCDCWPLWNENRDVCLIFTGEEFADDATIRHLKAKGHDFDADNASYLVHLYEELGADWVKQLNGWFSGVLVDLREQKVFLFNDRYGLNRIYYHENERGFFFSSEAKALLRVLPALRELDLRGLSEFIACGCVMQNRTLFHGIRLLPGASVITFSPGAGLRKTTYFRKEAWQEQPQLSSSDYYERLKGTWERILPRYFRGKARVGVSLTGGVDSRMIMAWGPCQPFKLRCYTFGGMNRDCVDVQIARRVTAACQQEHETIALTHKFFSEFPALAKRSVYLTDGSLDVTGAAELFVNKAAREIAPVRLTGNYGDEILRGNLCFKPEPLDLSVFDKGMAGLVRGAAQTYAEEVQDHRLSFVAFKQVPWYHASRASLERSQLTLRSPYLDNDLVVLAYQAPREATNDNQVSLRLIAEGNPVLEPIPTDRGLRYGPMRIWTRASNWYRETTAKAEYAFDSGMPQWLAAADRVLGPAHLERLFLGRHKFCHFRIWYRDQLANYIKDMLLDPRTRQRPYLRAAFLEELVNGHTRGNRNYTREIHKALTIELIQRVLIEQR